MVTLDPQYETGVVGNGSLRYNIQMARDAAGVWWQRHIWHRDDHRGELNPPVADPWIVSYLKHADPVRFKPVAA